VSIDGENRPSTADTFYDLSSLTEAKTYSLKVKALGFRGDTRDSDWSETLEYTVSQPEPTDPTDPSDPTEPQNPTEGLSYTLIKDDTEYSVSLRNVSDSEIFIPSEYNNLPVTEIADYDFKINDNFQTDYNFQDKPFITKVIIPNSVKTIGYAAFAYCFGLTNIYIPNSVTTIKPIAFFYCSGLTDINIPHNVSSIEYSAFFGCDNLYSATVAENNENYKSVDNCILTKDGKSLIFGCKNSVIPNSVIYIGDYAFSGYSNLTSITIPDNVTSIEPSAFFACDNLASITVLENNLYYKSVDNCLLTKDGKSLILGCKNSVIPNSVISIEREAFYYCTGLTSIEIPNSVISIGNYAFYDCRKLNSITLNRSIYSGITGLGNDIFYNCPSLTSIYVPADSVDAYKADANWSVYADKIQPIPEI
jgi:hypothetical protein